MSLDITNTLNSETLAQETMFMDYESYNLRLGLLYGLGNNWAIKVDIPFIQYSKGFLDSAIVNWHDFFGLPQADRPKVEDNQYRITYTRNNIAIIDLSTPDGGLGDVQIGLGRNIIQTTRSDISLWAAIDLPTGDKNNLTGNDAVDFSAWLSAEHAFNSNWHIDTNLGVLVPGDSQLGALEVESNVLFGHTGVQWRMHPAISLRTQLGGHTAFYKDSHLHLLGSTYNFVFGGTIHVSKCSDFDIAVSEDVKVGATPDVSFLFSWNTKVGDCVNSSRRLNP